MSEHENEKNEVLKESILHSSMKESKENLYIVRKFVVANSAIDAIKKEKTTPVHDVWVEESHQKMFIERHWNNTFKK